jgi:hypothetical protein
MGIVLSLKDHIFLELSAVVKGLDQIDDAECQESDGTSHSDCQGNKLVSSDDDSGNESFSCKVCTYRLSGSPGPQSPFHRLQQRRCNRHGPVLHPE